MLKSARSCHLLSALLTDWTAHNVDNRRLQLQPLTSLTRLTSLEISNTQSAEHITAFRCMKTLHTLHLADYHNLEYKAYSFKGLQDLTLSRGIDTYLDFTDLTRLTSLQILELGHELISITLPAGSAAGAEQVLLRHLSICDDSVDENDPHGVVLDNLNFAQQLTTLHIAYCKPLLHQNWAQALTQLQRVLLISVFDVPICEELTACAALQHLDLTSSNCTWLPSWFSGMTQLTLLNLDNTPLADFPDAIMHLSQLHILSMATEYASFVLQPDILTLAQWPNLKVIDLRCDQTMGGDYDLNSQLTLLELQAMLTERNKKCCLMINGFNIL